MQVAVYAVECKGSWRVEISLDLSVDRWWWSVARPEKKAGSSLAADSLVLLSSALPLGWAVKLRDNFKQRSVMGTWAIKEWGQYINSMLEAELREEKEAGGLWESQWLNDGIFIWKPNKSSFGIEQDNKKNERYCGSEKKGFDSGLLELDSEQLLRAVAGRSLLEPEVEALLAEELPELGGCWRQAAQLAHLQGRLLLTAAVGNAPPAAHGARARQLPAGAGVMMRAAARLPHLLW
ncbi:hypothetical protein P4H31_19635, partial [Paenibacillus odorifer]|nr:hypothetical protein [Paenibacillus odorifer]